jgi:hypothetical protein
LCCPRRPLYEAIVNGDKLELKETEHLILSTTYKCSFAVFEKCILIDVVQKKHFEEYLGLVESDEMELRKCFSINFEDLKFRIDQAKSLIG